MAEKTRLLNSNEFSIIAGQHAFNRILLEKDYFVTLILYLIKDVNGIYFKGGTALQKIFLNYSRLSEDIDLTLTRDTKIIQKEIESVLDKTAIFGKISKDKDVSGYVRMIIPYVGFNGNSGEIFIDLNEREKIIEKTELHPIKHFYSSFIPDFEFPTLSRNEMVAGKVAAAIGRNKPRDH
jgi:predicted nucleotidyltransferase component of viral defense system